MKRMILIAALSLVLLPGCFRSPAPRLAVGDSSAMAIPAAANKAAEVAQTIHEFGGGDIASSVISGCMRPYFSVGLALIALGAIAVAFKGWASGGGLIAMGVLVTSIGHISIRYPWIYLLVALPLAGLVVYAAYDRWRMMRGGEALVKSVACAEHKTEITEGIKGQGFDAEKAARYLLDPIRKALQKKGEI